MAQKRLNKNIIALLTVTGIVLSVAVVGVATFGFARRDPEFYAREARKFEQAGNFKQAEVFWRNAYEAGKQATYLVQAARCNYQLGEVGTAAGILSMAHAHDPQSQEVLEAILDLNWKLRDHGYARWNELKEFSEKLLELAPDHVLALVARADALEALNRENDPVESRTAAECLERAAQRAPDDPYVAISRAMRVLWMPERDSAGKPRPLTPDEAQQRRQQAVEILRSAWEKNRTHVRLTFWLSETLASLGQMEQAQAVAEQATTEAPTDPDLQFQLARILFQRVLREPEDSPQRDTLLTQAASIARKAVDLEPALYEGYTLLARLRLAALPRTAEVDRPKLYEEALKTLEEAVRRTAGLKSFRTALGVEARMQLIVTGFETALDYYHAAPDEARRKEAHNHARQFLADATTEFPGTFITHYLHGELALIERDVAGAVQAYTKAEETSRDAAQGGGPVARRVYRAAIERLAFLYRQTRQDGYSLRYTERAIDLYRDAGEPVPTRLWVNQGQLLVALEQPQKALDMIATLPPEVASEPEIKTIRAAALAGTGRGAGEVKQVLAEAQEDPGALILRARLAVVERNLDEASQLLRRVLDQQPERLDAIQFYGQVMQLAQRQSEALEYLEALRQRLGEDARLVIDAQKIILTTPDPQECDARILKLVESIEDPRRRLRELYTYHADRRQFDRAAECLDQLEKLEPSDAEVLEAQFSLALSQRQLDRAERYCARLGQVNADRVGGGLYRARLKLAREDPEGALVELRAAEAELPTSSLIKYFKAVALLASNPPRSDEAIQILKNLLEYDPRHFDANRLLYQVYEQLGQRDQGVPYLRRAASINPDDPFVRERSEFIAEEENPRQALARRAELRRKEPDNVDNLVRLAELSMKVGDDAGAEEYLRAIAEREPGREALAQLAARFYGERRNRSAGEELLKRHLQGVQGVPAVRGHLLLGRFYERLGDTDAALEAYRQLDQRLPELVNDEKQLHTLQVQAAFELVEFLHRAKRFDDAADASLRVLERVRPGETEFVQRARLLHVEALFRGGRLEEAENQAAAYVREFPRDSRGMRMQAQVLLARDKFAEARELLSRVLQDNRDDAWALMTRGAVHLQLGDFTEAREDLLKAKQLAPDGFNYSHRLNLARLYQMTGQTQLAEAELTELVRLQPENPAFATSLLTLLTDTGQVEKAQVFIGEMAARQPQSGLWPYQMGVLLGRRGDWSGALQNIQRALELEPQNPQYLADWLNALTRARRAPEAVATYEKLSPQAISPEVRAYAAEAYAATGRPDKARELMQQAIEEGSRTRPDALLIAAGRAVAALGRETGLELLRAAIQKAATPDEGSILRNVLARYLAEGKDPAGYQEADKLLEYVFQHCEPGSMGHVDALLIRAQLCEATGRTAEMADAYEQALRYAPDNLMALNNLAYVLADKLNRAAEALPYAERAAKLGQRNAAILDTVGWVYFRNDRLQQAEAALREAVRLDPTQLPIRDHLGQVLRKAGRTREARRVYQELLERAEQAENVEMQRLAKEALKELE